MFTFISMADQFHKFNDSLIALLPVEELKKPISQAENVRYGITVTFADQLDSALSNLQDKMKFKG